MNEQTSHSGGADRLAKTKALVMWQESSVPRISMPRPAPPQIKVNVEQTLIRLRKFLEVLEHFEGTPVCLHLRRVFETWNEPVARC